MVMASFPLIFMTYSNAGYIFLRMYKGQCTCNLLNGISQHMPQVRHSLPRDYYQVKFTKLVRPYIEWSLIGQHLQTIGLGLC